MSQKFRSFHIPVSEFGGFFMLCLGALTATLSAKVYEADHYMPKALGKTNIAARAAALEKLAASLKAGDALILPSEDFGEADLSDMPNDIEVSGGVAGKIFVGGIHSDLTFVNNRIPIILQKRGESNGSNSLNNAFFWNNSNSGSKSNVSNSLFLEEQAKAQKDVIETNLWTPATYTDMPNTTFLYFSYNVGGNNCGTGKDSPAPRITFKGNFAGSKVYHMVETNYGMVLPGVKFDGVKGPMHLLVGDTERHGAAYAEYEFLNSSDIVLGSHRLYSGTECNTGCPQTGFLMTGGQRNTLMYSQEISKAKIGLRAVNETDLQIWGLFTELDIAVPADALQAFVTPRGYGPDALWCNAVPNQRGSWHEPVEVESEVIFKYKGVDLTDKAKGGTVIPPKPPEFPPTEFTGSVAKKMSAPRYLQKANFGAAVLAAGADASGQKYSDAAFMKVLNETGKLEIPAGTFLLKNTLTINVDDALAKSNGNPEILTGQGASITKIVMNNPNISAVKLVGSSSLARTSALEVQTNPDQKLKGISNVEITGGKFGIDLTCFYAAAMRFVNVTISNSSSVGIAVGGTNIGQYMESCGAREFDQNRFINVKFINTGDYGIYINLPMVDKQFYLNCEFEGQKKAGISANYTHMFNGSIIQCKFKDINGPGVDLYTIASYPGGSIAGYTPHCSAIESCEFINCGNTERGAVDFGWTESNTITNSKITIKGKPWKFAYIGTAGLMQNVIIDVDKAQMVSGGAAVALRSTRHVRNARPTGNILHKVTGPNGVAINGPLAFINDVNKEVSMDTYFKDKDGSPKYSGYKWAYPSAVIESKFSNGSCEYALVATKKEGGILDLVPLAGTNTLDNYTASPVSVRSASSSVIPALAKSPVYDLSGRKMGVSGTINKDLPNGVYIQKSLNGKSQLLAIP